MKYYYDAEYGRVISAKEVKRQYDFFALNYVWFDKSYADFVHENFRLVRKFTLYGKDKKYITDMDDFEALKERALLLGGSIKDDHGKTVFAG